jgi:hypothetical protein
MSVSNGLRELARQLQANADAVLEEAEKSQPLFDLVTDVVANAVVHLEKAAAAIEDREPVVTGELLDTIAYLANALDETGDAVLQKKASLLDELLVTISAPKSAVAQARRQSEDELARLREKYRDQNREEIYKTRTRSALDKMNQKEKTQGLVEDQVKTYRVLQAPLQTRSCPDHPGVGMIRVADSVFQCALDHKVYDYRQGYTTMKGNKVPGGSVDQQVPDWGQYDGATVFDTRETLMSRYAEGDPRLAKRAQQKDYEYGMKTGPDGKKYLEVRVSATMPEQRKRQIAQEIQGTMGSLYPIRFAVQ